jgi:hypothetical protein
VETHYPANSSHPTSTTAAASTVGDGNGSTDGFWLTISSFCLSWSRVAVARSLHVFNLAQVLEGWQRGQQGGGLVGRQFLDELRQSLGIGAAPAPHEVRPGGGQLDQNDALVGRVGPAHDKPVAFQGPDQDSHRGLRHALRAR